MNNETLKWQVIQYNAKFWHAKSNERKNVYISLDLKGNEKNENQVNKKKQRKNRK